MSYRIFLKVGYSADDWERLEANPEAKAANDELIGEDDTPRGAYVRINAGNYPEDHIAPHVEMLRRFGISPIITMFEPREYEDIGEEEDETEEDDTIEI